MLTPSFASWCDLGPSFKCTSGLPDDLVKMKVFVTQGVSCFSGATFDCTSSFENWQMVLKEEGRRVYPGRNPDTMIFQRVHMAIQEASRSSDLDLSFLEPVIGPRLHGCGIYWTCVKAREVGSFITTIKGSDTRECRSTKETSLPVMSEVIAPPFSRRIT